MKLNRLRSLLVIVFCFFVFLSTAIAQGADQSREDHSYRPLVLKLNEDGSKYVRFIMWHQVWLATNNLEVTNAKVHINPSLRRSRFLAYGQISPRFLILTHFGLNSLTPENLTSLGGNGDAPQLFLHGAWGELKVLEPLYVGAGLHYWNGMTRLSSQSTINFMTLDQSRPFIAWHSLGITDQFGRHLGVYAKGQLGRFDYRVAFNAPLRNNIGDGQDYGLKDGGLTYNGVLHPNKAGEATGNTIITGYFRYNFLDIESTKLPYQVGTYLGQKSVFGLGAGFFTHPNGMYNAQSGEHSHVTHFAIDAFLDMPTGIDGDAINTYVAFMWFDYGPNYVSRWAGTGNAVYAQFGYFLHAAKLMPYVGFQSGDYDGLDEKITALDIGLNYFINGHNAKLTLEYHKIKGDIRESAIASASQGLSQLRLQLQIFL